MKFYSQFGQDEFIYNSFFKNKKDGFFVDIGASDPVEGSNTLFFEELGWNGILVEPNKFDVEKLRQKRKSPVENVAIYNKSGNSEFLALTGYTKVLSGLLTEQDPRHLNRIKSEIAQFGGEAEIINVETITFGDLLDKHNQTKIDYLSIDTEGSEFSILESIDYDKFNITCISVENNYNENNIKQLLESKGFAKIKDLVCDEIYFSILNYNK